MVGQLFMDVQSMDMKHCFKLSLSWGKWTHTKEPTTVALHSVSAKGEGGA
jgi:hypothetical protein